MGAFAMQQNLVLLVIGISTLAAGLTFLGVPLAERFDVSHRIITALVAVTLMPLAVSNGPYVLAVFALFAGGVLHMRGCRTVMRKLSLLSPKNGYFMTMCRCVFSGNLQQNVKAPAFVKWCNPVHLTRYHMRRL